MSTYILVHGAWHGAWCWQRVTPLLEQDGHTVIAPDLPGHGDDLTPLAAVTLASYVQRIVDLIDTLSDEEPLILVGHSFAGMVISQVAEARPERIGLLVYISALLPKSGETAFQITEQEANPKLAACLLVDDLSVSLLPRKARAVFYQDCDTQAFREAKRHLTPQALLPFNTPVTLTERFAQVPRIYLTCRYDLVISADLQRRMYSQTPCQQVIWLMTGHSPFLAAPDRLAARLLGIAHLARDRR